MTTGPESASGIHASDINIYLFAATRQTGRPVAERLADKSFLTMLGLQHGINIGTAPTRYADSRAGTQMNIDALEAFTGGETQQMLDSFAWLRERYFAHKGGPPDQITDEHLWNLSIIGEALPSYLILRARNPINRMELPEVVGNMYKSYSDFVYSQDLILSRGKNILILLPVKYMNWQIMVDSYMVMIQLSRVLRLSLS